HTHDTLAARFEAAAWVDPTCGDNRAASGDESAARPASRRYQDWICDARRMNLAKPDALYMHCLPADRGNEVADEVIDGPQSVVYDEAENRLHTGKALMALTMGGFA